MPEINLLKNEIKSQRGIPLLPGANSKLIYTIVVIAVLEILVYLTFAILNQTVKRRVAGIELSETQTKAEISQLDSERLKAISLQKRLNNLAGLLTNHAEWTPVFAELEKFTFKPAVYSSFQVDEVKHTFALNGVVPTYTEIGKLMIGLAQSKNFKNITLQSTNQDDSGKGGVSFMIQVEFDPKLLTKK